MRECVEVAREWIRENLMERETVYPWSTSSEFRQKVSMETGWTITNKEFKKAMELEGYKPTNPSGVHHKYRVCYKGEYPNNNSGFYRWIARFEGKPGRRGLFATDVAQDFEFPRSEDKQTIIEYFKSLRADEALKIFKELWRSFKRSKYFDRA